jgi:hypothetical protein
MWPLILWLLAVAPVSPSEQQEAPAQLDLRSWKLDCTRLDSLKEGKPVFFGSMTDVRIGIATGKPVVALGEPIIVDLWVDNRSEKPTWSGGECLPYWNGGDVFDSTGRRLISIHDQMKLDAEKNGHTTVEVCSMSPPVVMTPPHTCNGPRAAGEVNLVLDHNLPPGLYYVFPIRGVDPALFKQGLMIKVRER